MEISFPNGVENIQTIFDTDRSSLQPDYTKLSIEEFDLYAFTVYTFMNLFWESFDIESNRITKRFHFWIQRNVDDLFPIDSAEFENGQLSRIEEFFTALNWHFKLYDLKTLQMIDYRIRENNAALDRCDPWNADVKYHPFKGMKDDVRYGINWLVQQRDAEHTFIYNDVLHVLKQLNSKLSRHTVYMAGEIVL